jgi:uncharacterized membrane protein HdeD (DUF308 family)
MLLAQVAHTFEEVLGRFWLVNEFGFGWFLLINWILLLVPTAFFYFVLLDKRWAYYLSIVYAGIMILNGIGHNIASLVTRRYFNGFAGGFSGILFIVIGPFLIYYLWKGMSNGFR